MNLAQADVKLSVIIDIDRTSIHSALGSHRIIGSFRYQSAVYYVTKLYRKTYRTILIIEDNDMLGYSEAKGIPFHTKAVVKNVDI